MNTFNFNLIHVLEKHQRNTIVNDVNMINYYNALCILINYCY